ncbi:MAG: glycosyltransferase family 4 protein [Anaerolineae bacterium]|nr:glycosyltransferase family 4 protein [Thermoflexus sp.]MDW8064134.1 glycosyltransferase family 4 protein [Anaerolineae bacterium]
MRVLMIAPTSFFNDYGCHVRILEEARALQSLGIQVKIVTYYKGRDPAGLDIIRTPPLPWRSHYEVGSSRHKIAFDLYLAATSLVTALRWRPHLLHAHLHEGALIGVVLRALLRVPLIFDFQGSLTGEMIDHRFLNPDGPWYPLMRRLEVWLDQQPDLILTSTIHGARLLIHAFGVSPDRVIPFPDAVNVEVFRPPFPEEIPALQRLRETWGIPPERRLVVYLGLLAPYQGTDLLLKAAARVVRIQPHVHFLIMGFPGETNYRAQAATLGISDHITFTGKVPYEQAPLYLRLGELAVAPKMSATEGSGKLLNYMATGLPVVAFDTPVSREFMGEEGYYARWGDADSLAEQILYALRHTEESAERGRRLRTRAMVYYSWKAAGKILLDIYTFVQQGACFPARALRLSQKRPRVKEPSRRTSGAGSRSLIEKRTLG